MKILLVAKPWKGGLSHYLFQALQDLFPNSVEWWPTYPVLAERFDYIRNKKRWREALARKIERSDYTAAIFIGMPLPLQETRNRDRNVLWHFDSPRPTPDQVAPFGRVYISDPGYSPEVLAALEPERFGGELTFAHSPAIHHLPATAPRRSDICFIGNKDPKRDPQLAYLFTAGYRPMVYGNYFLRRPIAWRYPQCFRPAVGNQEMGGVYAEYKISLNIHAEVVRQGTNMRTFECAGYGIPQVVEYRPGLEKHFEPGSEILTYHDPEEMPEQIERLLRDPKFAAELALRAHRRAIAAHTYYHRAATLLSELLSSDEQRGLDNRLRRIFAELK
jgi:spore maturation protein CgeB